VTPKPQRGVKKENVRQSAIKCTNPVDNLAAVSYVLGAAMVPRTYKGLYPMTNPTETQTLDLSAIELTFGGKKKRKVDGKELPPFTAKTVTINFPDLPQSAQDKIIEYGLTQYIGDGTAGAVDQTDFDSGIDARVERLKSGDFTRTTTRGESNPYASVEKLATVKCRETLKQKLVTAGVKKTGEEIKKLVADVMADEVKAAKYIKAAQDEINKQAELAPVDLSEFGL
jgi:hypothetical protein